MVVCETCKKEYESIFQHTNQGIDCSAEADEKGVIGHYGSTLVDLEVWRWTTGKPLHVKNGIICDECIKPLMESGALEFERSYWG
jgi:hypothetical protein